MLALLPKTAFAMSVWPSLYAAARAADSGGTYLSGVGVRRALDVAGQVVMSMSLMVASAAFAQTSHPAGAPVLLEATVVERHHEQDMVALSIGREAGVGVGDSFWVFDQSQISARGSVFLVTPDACVGRLAISVGKVVVGASALILQEASLHMSREVLPENVTLRGRLLNLPPGRRTAWVDLGRRAGLRLGDSLLVGRNGIPIARGRVSLLEDETALATLQPLVGNTLSQPGDTVGLWPEPYQQRLGRVNSTVLDVRSDPEGALVTLVGSAADGLQEDRLVDLFRDGNYVGVAVLVEISDPLSVARIIESACAQMPEVGDRAIVRSDPGPPVRPLAAAVFRVVEGDYCLLAAGESDSVRIGEKFIIRRSDPEDSARTWPVAQLTVQTVKVHHSGCNIRLLGDSKTRLMPWDWAEREKPPWPHWVTAGVVKQVDQTARLAVVYIDTSISLARGQVVRWVPPAQADQTARAHDLLPGAAIVLNVTSNKAHIYVPSGWGDIEHLNHACVQVTETVRKLNVRG